MTITNSLVLPNTIANGNSLDATPVMQNLSYLLAALNRAVLDPGSGAIPFGNSRLASVADGVSSTDAATVGQVTASLASGYLPLTGGTLTGSLHVLTDLLLGSDANGWGRMVNAGSALYFQSGTLDSGAAVALPFYWTNMLSTTPRMSLDAAGNLSTTGAIAAGGAVSDSLGSVRVLARNAQSAAYTLALSDIGKFVWLTTSGGGAVTIPANSTVAFPVGTHIVVVNDDPTTPRALTRAVGVSLIMAGNSTNQDRTIAPAGLASLLKVNTDTWYVLSGNGIS